MGIISFIVSILIGLLVRKIVMKLVVRVIVWRELLKDKEVARWFWKRAAIVISSVALVVVVLIFGISIMSINANMRELLQRDVDEYMMHHINRLDERIANWGAPGKLLIRNQDQYEALKQENDRFIDDAAAQLIEAIDALEPVEKFESYEHMRQVENEIAALRIRSRMISNDDDKEYCEELERRVTNYSKLLEYHDAYKELVNECKEKCEKCDIAGYIISACGACGGEGSTQIFNNGRKIECRKCGGDGRNIEKCEVCINGYIYNFE